jgi:uroporphyrinogen-III synthase
MVTKSAQNGSLNGLKVLVTRPEQQSATLCNSIMADGGIAIALPVIDIVPISPWNESKISINQQDMIIFVSRNAVIHFMAGMQASLSDNIQLVAVGAGTAETMRKHGLRVDIQPPPPGGSDALLLMPELNKVQNKRILIVRGDGGREHLADTLIARDAKIEYLEVYQRGLATRSDQEIELAKTADCIVITSVAGLDNLCQLIEINELTSKWLVVMSERIRQYALSLGFQHCVVVDDASDAAVMQQVNRMEQKDGKK